MADYVFVHGGNMTTETWNRLTVGKPVHTPDGTMGGRIWDPFVPVIAAAGHRAFAHTRADEHSGTLAGHIGQVCGIIGTNGLAGVVLAGHSYGGMVITGAAARMPGRIRRLVYIDAALPNPGQSLFDLIREGGRDPLSFPGLEPDPPYVEKLQFDPAAVRAIRKTYVLCTKSDFSAITKVAKDRIASEKTGWTYIELPSSHVPMAEMPDELCRLLLDASER